MTLEDLIEESEFAKAIHVSVTRLKKWRKFCDAPFYRIGRKVYYNPDEFWYWFDNDAIFL